MILNEYGIIAHNEWVNTPKIRPNVELGEFIIMPNHIHGIIAITDRPPIRRGELHSPLLDLSQMHSPLLDSDDIKKGVCKTPQPDVGNRGEYQKGECNSPIPGVCKTPIPDVGITGEYQKGECNSPLPGVCKTPQPDVGNRGEYQKGECNSPIPGVCKTPIPDVGITGEYQRGECNSPQPGVGNTGEYQRGECNSPQPDVGITGEYQKGECNSPQRSHLTGECNRGECNSPQRSFLMGECNSPLRSPSQTVGAIVRGYKSSVTKQLGVLGFNEKLWQRNYYEHIIRNDQSFQNITEYIITNPMKWDNDTFNPLN
jgi:REP element-mobilizing transposase RayT